jgi:hypothetical protein
MVFVAKLYFQNMCLFCKQILMHCNYLKHVLLFLFFENEITIILWVILHAVSSQTVASNCTMIRVWYI